jgi:hypothetical protein
MFLKELFLLLVLQNEMFIGLVQEEPGYGADVLRLWVSSVDYTTDVLIGPQILRQMSDMYRKLRGTMRFLLSNLHDWKVRPSGQTQQQQSLFMDFFKMIEAARNYFGYRFFMEIIAIVAWEIWKQRNASIFRDSVSSFFSWRSCFNDTLKLQMFRFGPDLFSLERAGELCIFIKIRERKQNKRVYKAENLLKNTNTRPKS